MNTPIEQKTFEELLELHLDIPQVEEEGKLEVSVSPKENAVNPDESLMPEEKLIHRRRLETDIFKNEQKKSVYKMRTANVKGIEADIKDHKLRDIARSEINTMRNKHYYGGIISKNRVFYRDLNADQNEQIQAFLSTEMDEFETVPLETLQVNNLSTTYDEFTGNKFSIFEHLPSHAAGLSLITPPGVIFFF